MEALITGIVAIVVCVLNNLWQSKKTGDLIDYKLTVLTEKVEQHNSVVARTYELEKDVAILKNGRNGE